MSHHHTQKDLYSQYISPFWKLPGETLSTMLERFRTEKNVAPEEKMTYAGRLDPMAEGIVPVLVGEMRFQKDALLAVDKTYELTVLLGVSTDSADMLGLVTTTAEVSLDEEKIMNSVRALSSVEELAYPMYSSRPVEGKPLFVHARAGTAVTVPTKKVRIGTIEGIHSEQTTLGACLMQTFTIIEKVQGDFRQKEITELWQKQSMDQKVILVTFSTTVSSGTYMRSLAEVLGERLGVPALAYKIVRTRVGEYTRE